MRSLFKKLKKGKEKSWVSNSYWKKQQANKKGREIFSARHILNILSAKHEMKTQEKYPRLSCRVEVASNGLVEPIHHLRALLAKKTPTLSSSWYPCSFLVVDAFPLATLFIHTWLCDDHCRKMLSECVVRPYFLCVWFIGWFWTTLRASQSVLTNTNPFPHYKCVQLSITTKDCQIWYDSKLHKRLHRK